MLLQYCTGSILYAVDVATTVELNHDTSKNRLDTRKCNGNAVLTRSIMESRRDARMDKEPV
jgi:hypothetical protein